MLPIEQTILGHGSKPGFLTRRALVAWVAIILAVTVFVIMAGLILHYTGYWVFPAADAKPG